MVEPVMDNGVQSSSTEPVLNSGAQPQSTELLRNEGEQPQSPVSLDSLPKVIAVALVILYMSGFLITSLHNFKYGFSEMNPLRPRILAAGGWYAIFMAVPFVLVWQLRKHSVLKDKSNNLTKFATLIAVYMGPMNFLIIWTQGLFVFDDTGKPVSGLPVPWWQIALFVLGFLVALGVFVFVVLELKSRLPKWAIDVLILVFFGYILWSAYYELFSKHSFKSNALYFWIFVIGGYIYYELHTRKWSLQVGSWDITLVGFFFSMTIFATVYYPHIMAKWGGGALIPIELTFSKDAPVRSGVQVDCSLIDETDAGFYVVGRQQSSATFIPRTEVSSIYYAQGNGHSVLTDSLPQQTPSLPPNSPVSNQPTIMQATPSQQPISAADQGKTAQTLTTQPEPQAHSK